MNKYSFEAMQSDMERTKKERERKNAWYDTFHEGWVGKATQAFTTLAAFGGEAFGLYKIHEASPDTFNALIGLGVLGGVLSLFAAIPAGSSLQQEKNYRRALALSLPISGPFVLGHYVKEGLANLPYAIPDRPRRKRQTII